MEPTKDPPTRDLIQDKEAEETGLRFRYQVAFDPKQGALLLKIFDEDKPVTRFERYGIHVLSLQDRYIAGSRLDPAHRHFIQHLLRFAHLHSWEGYYLIPRKHTAYFLQRLSKFEEVKSFQASKKVPFSKKSLTPLFDLKADNFSHLSFRLRFREEESGEEYAWEKSVLFPGNRPWVLRDGVFFPLKSTEANVLLDDLDGEGNVNLSGERAVEFLEQDLSALVKRGEVTLPPGFQIPEVVRFDPQVQYSVTEDSRKDKLCLHIQFAYGEFTLPPYERESDLLVYLPSAEKPLLLYRNLPFEKETLEKFYSQGFQRVGPSRFETGGESALDFVSDQLPTLKEEAGLQGEESLKQFRVLAQLGRGNLKARAVARGVDWFSLDLRYELEGQEIPFEVLRKWIQEGKKYLPIPGKGFARIRTEELKALEEGFEELEGEWTEQGELRFKTFHAPYLDEVLKVDWKAQGELSQTLSSLRQLQGIPSRELPQGMEAVLRPYQHHGYDWLQFLHEHQFHGILADDMGLGKTLQALAYLRDLKERKGSRPNLVLAPTSVVFNWASESQKFTPDLRVLQLTGAERKENYDQIEGADLVLTSYAIFRRDAELLQKISWRSVILDEAQYIKNYRSKTAGLVKELSAEQRLALTGTPLENRLSELWSIFDFLMPGFLGSFLGFQRRYQKPIEESQDAEALSRLKKRLHPFVMRRQKEEVAPELPPKTEIEQFCEMTPEQRKLYEEILVTCRRMVLSEVEEKGIEKSQFSILTALLRLRQVCCHPRLLGEALEEKETDSGKLEMFKELLDEIISEGHRVIVFSQFVEMLTLLREWLDEQKIAYEYLDGRTRKREERIKRFQSTPEIPVFLISLKAGGTGLNLSEADYVIHYDPWWNPAVQDQATDRVHRLGQKQHVFSYKLITKDSVEEKILGLQQRKRDLVKGVLGIDSSIGKKLSYEDLEYLFS